jgi:hypothetical protein
MTKYFLALKNIETLRNTLAYEKKDYDDVYVSSSIQEKVLMT